MNNNELRCNCRPGSLAWTVTEQRGDAAVEALNRCRIYTGRKPGDTLTTDLWCAAGDSVAAVQQPEISRTNDQLPVPCTTSGELLSAGPGPASPSSRSNIRLLVLRRANSPS